MMEPVEFYELRKVTIDWSKVMIATAAVRSCGLCGAAINGMGGPGEGSVCTECAADLKACRLRGCVVREPKP